MKVLGACINWRLRISWSDFRAKLLSEPSPCSLSISRGRKASSNDQINHVLIRTNFRIFNILLQEKIIKQDRKTLESTWNKKVYIDIHPKIVQSRASWIRFKWNLHRAYCNMHAYEIHTWRWMVQQMKYKCSESTKKYALHLFKFAKRYSSLWWKYFSEIQVSILASFMLPLYASSSSNVDVKLSVLVVWLSPSLPLRTLFHFITACVMRRKNSGFESEPSIECLHSLRSWNQRISPQHPTISSDPRMTKTIRCWKSLPWIFY